ncbi:unnamed protein product [Clavelina lepadiformis]|uniref:Lipoxygenase domain-containing protein n=1 Tax=Clavelina lepadiformis TaxID=159417 RepID=A0ABP0GCQ2_CLALP
MQQSVAKLFGYVCQWLCVILLGLPVSVIYFILHLQNYVRKLRLQTAKHVDGEVGHFHGGQMVEIRNVSTKEQIDFMTYRSPTYIKQLLFGSLWEFSKLTGSQQSVPLIDDHVLHHVILNSVFCHGLIKGDENSDIEWRLPFTLENYHVFKGFYWDVSEIRLHHNHQLTIVDKTGKIHTQESKTWNLAKAHAQAQLTFFAPGLAHNHVHFVFPSLVSSQVRKMLPPTSVLRQLLDPHTRFTQYINYQALNECQSSKNTGSLIDRIFRPWLSFPISNDDFIGGIQKKCETFYYDNFTLTQELHDELPYHAFLKSYCVIVRKFVEELEPLLKDDYAELFASMNTYLPSLTKHDLVDVITTLIWNCGVVHYSDHHSYLQQFAFKYGCMSMRIPLVQDDHSSSINATAEIPDSMNSDLGARASLFAAEDIYRTRCFLRTFVQYNGNPNLDMSLKCTKYDFTDKAAISSAKSFLEGLTDLDSKLRQRGNAILPLSNIIRSVCF